jgi:hypothetical protein
MPRVAGAGSAMVEWRDEPRGEKGEWGEVERELWRE